jgi:hypothetical protein
VSHRTLADRMEALEREVEQLRGALTKLAGSLGETI